MKTTKNISIVLRALAVLVIFTAASCSTQEDFVKPEAAPAVANNETTSLEEATVSSLTVSGEFTEYREQAECSTCTYVVPADAKVVDGKKFKPGDVICLTKGVKYNMALEFVNLKGTGEKPVVIASCGE